MKTAAITDRTAAVAGTVTEALGDALHVSADRLADLASVAADKAGDVTHRVADHLPDPEAVRKAGRRAARKGRRTARSVRRDLPKRNVPTLAIAALVAAVIGAALWWRSRRGSEESGSRAGWYTGSPSTPEETAALVGG